MMHPIERVLAVLDGKIPDRVPTFCAGMEDRTFNEILGKPLIKQEWLLTNPVARFVMDKGGPALTKTILQPEITKGMEKRTSSSVKLGFDSIWSIYDETFTLLDSHTMLRYSGSIFEIRPDGFGNMTYMYMKPGITTPAEFDAWPYWPDPDALAHNTFKFFKKMVAQYGQDCCLFGQGPVYGIQESLLWAVGFERMVLWIRREKERVAKYIARLEELSLKTSMAMMDAGIRVILHTDDYAFKSGPILNPKMIDEVFGPSYERIIRAVHQRGGKFVLHSCGDNTLVFDTFIKWAVDGLHAYEPTSNVDIFREKQLRGSKVTMIGGVGVDYLLTEQSRDEEIVEAVRVLIERLAPGGRFLLGPAHSLSSIPAEKLRVMLSAAQKYGSYS